MSEIKTELVPYNELKAMAQAVVKSHMFGVQSEEQAIALMLICQAEGLHPMKAAQRYHIIQGRATYKTERLLADFIARGGTIKWITRTATECKAIFCSKGCPEGVEVCWTMDDAKRAGLTAKDIWKNYPRQMLSSRVTSEGVRAADPGCTDGMLTESEAIDLPTIPASLQEVALKQLDEPKTVTFDQRKELTKAARARGLMTAEETLAHIKSIASVDQIADLTQEQYEAVMKKLAEPQQDLPQ